MVITVLASAWFVADRRDRSTATGTGSQGGAGSPPWPPPGDPRPFAEAAGLDLGPMGMAEHYHPRLQIFVDGDRVDVPAGIGIDPFTGAMSALHTHTPDGVLHVEADDVGQAFTLGQLFTQWDVQLGPTRIGGLSGQLMVSVGGQRHEGDPRTLRLAPNQRIEMHLST